MTDTQRPHVGAVIRETVVEVDQQGTVAAAATAVVMRGDGGLPTVAVQADRPFLLQVVDDATQAIVIVGRVAKP